MFLIEIFLPTFDNQGQKFPAEAFESVRRELAEQFGGVTAFTRAPASGLWADDAGHMHRDNLVIFEVMSERLDRPWWHDYRRRLEERFRQQEIVARATECQRI